MDVSLQLNLNAGKMKRKLVIIQTVGENGISNTELQNEDKIPTMELMGILRYLEKKIFVQCCKESDKLLKEQEKK